MKVIFRNILSIFMALAVLFSTMSFTVGIHYCGDVLVSVSVFQKTKCCEMETQTVSENLDYSAIKKNCCDDTQLVVVGQDELKLSPYKLSFQQKQFITSFVYSYLSVFKSLEKTQDFFKKHSPPTIVRQLYKLDQVYLI